MTQSDWHAAAAAASVTRLSGCRGGARAAGRPGSLVTRRRTRAGPGLDQSVAATVTVTVTAAPGPFSDQPQSHWHGGATDDVGITETASEWRHDPMDSESESARSRRGPGAAGGPAGLRLPAPWPGARRRRGRRSVMRPGQPEHSGCARAAGTRGLRAGKRRAAQSRVTVTALLVPPARVTCNLNVPNGTCRQWPPRAPGTVTARRPGTR